MIKKKKLTQVKAGEWVQPIRRGYLMGCCDCNLVHRMDFRIENDRVQFRAFRAEGHTKVQRKLFANKTKKLGRL